MNHEDDFKTTQGENDPKQVQDPSNLSQNETPQKEPDDQTADFRTLATSPANEPVRNPPNTRPLSSIDKAAEKAPRKVGRYAIKKLLGRGGFGEVYLGLDDQLRREVAIKLTFGSRVGPAALKMLLAEAQMLAELDHPNIIPVFDLGTTDCGDIFIVSKFIDGMDLATRIEKNRPSRELSLEIIASIADALHYAHSKGLIHRDIKPANILLDKNDRPYLADFGVALRETDQTEAGEIAGTPAYMSPEQARGEGHLISNQSDIYSLGVVLYELLSGRRPFKANSARELLRMVQTTEIRTPRTFDATISRELERVCLKALARRPSDRFAIAKDLADEVRYVISSHLEVDSTKPAPVSSYSGNRAASASDRIDSRVAGQMDSDLRSGPVQVIPKGLRSFDEKDTDFFLDLLPGPFDRTGLPEGLRFWKNRIEATDANKSFRVGLVYGPSGCGKSSLMKAGLLPRLSNNIEAIYIEATPDDTTNKLLREIQKRIPEVPGTNLADALSIIRRRKLVPSGGKLLLVIDQFEQWLYGHKNYSDTELTNALRQCDGSTIQAIVMVRDDFWLSVSRFLRELDIPIVERENSAMVDLFDLEHAKKVLALFGRAYDKLPLDRSEWTQDHKQFLQQAVEGLSQEEKVISVRLALFAEMMKSKPWIPKTLSDLGGIAGVGVTFLEETFGDAHAPIQFRQHQEGVRSLLGALLPAVGTNIKGHRRALSDLQKVVRYEDRPREFDELVSLLDKNLRLITPADDAQESGQESRSYQLTHDYLVPSLREWINQKQRETKKGRAELKLAERAATWGNSQENRQLPTLLEWLQIRSWTQPKRWTIAEQAVMQKAGRVHLRNWGAALLGLLVTGGVIGYAFQQQHVRSQTEKINVVLDSLQKTLGPSVYFNIEELKKLNQPKRIRDDLEERYKKVSEGSSDRRSLAIALAHFGRVELDYLINQLEVIDDQDRGNLMRALAKDPQRSIEKLKSDMDACTTVEQQRRKARLALAALGIGDTELATKATEFEDIPDPGVRTWFIDEFPRWEIDTKKLVNDLEELQSPALRSAICLGIGQRKNFTDSEKSDATELVNRWYWLPDSSTHSAVTWLMRKWDIQKPERQEAPKIEDDPNWWVNDQGVTFVRIRPLSGEFEPLPDLLGQDRQRLRQIKEKPAKEQKTAEVRYQLGTLSYALGEYEEALEEFDAVLELPWDESSEVFGMDPYGFRLLTLARMKRPEATDVALAQWRATNPSPEVSIYMESVVSFWLGRKTESEERLRKGLESNALSDRNTQYLLARTLACFAADGTATPAEKSDWAKRAIEILERWSDGDEYARNKMRSELDFLVLHRDPRFIKLTALRSDVPEQPYWIANREVTRGEFEEFINDENPDVQKPSDRDKSKLQFYERRSPTVDHPVQYVSWYDAVLYCNWLSRKEGLTPAYRSSGKTKEVNSVDGEVEVDLWQPVEGADGYRLPSKSEWYYACRAGSKTEWNTGSDEKLLEPYCTMFPSKQTSPCGDKLPNAWGLHDMHGNVWEWCWDQAGSNRVDCGGAWNDPAWRCRSGESGGRTPVGRHSDRGFRIVRSSIGK
jgi:serine/threonine protein kinase